MDAKAGLAQRFRFRQRLPVARFYIIRHLVGPTSAAPSSAIMVTSAYSKRASNPSAARAVLDGRRGGSRSSNRIDDDRRVI